MRLATALFALLVPTIAVAGPTERRVYSSSASASSNVPNYWDTFNEHGHANYALDDDAKTAWVENSRTSGAGEWWRINLAALDKTTKVKLKIRNGCQKTKDEFTQNARPKEVTVRLLPANIDTKITLADKDGWQDVAEIVQPSGMLKGVEIRVGTVYEGSKTKDMCISDVQVLATSETPNVASFETAKQKALADWRASRAAYAKVYTKKTTPLENYYNVTVKDWKATGTGFLAMIAAGEQDKIIGMEIKYALVRAKKLVENFPTVQKATWTVKATDRMMPPTDGVQIPTITELAMADFDETSFRMPMIAGAGILFRDQITVTDAKDKLTPDDWAKQTGACKGDASWVVRAESSEMGKAPPIVEQLIVGKCAMITDRSGKPRAHREREIYEFGPDGQIVLVVGETHIEGYRWGLEHGNPMITGARSLLAGSGKVIDAREPLD